MSVEFKSPVTSSNVNQAFLDKNKDTETQFKLALNHTGSGDPILDAQQAINDNATNLETHEASYIAHREFDTKANLDTWAATADNGSFAFATDEKKSYQVIDGVLAEIGGGGGGISAWESATSYVIGNVVYYLDENIYRCIADNSDVTFTPANWQELSENPYVNNLTVTAQDNLTVTDSVGTRLLKSENYELYYQDFKDTLPSDLFTSVSASLTVVDAVGTETSTSNTMATITQSSALAGDSAEIVIALPTKKADWHLTPIKIQELLQVKHLPSGAGTFGVTLEQSNDGITFTEVGNIPELKTGLDPYKSILQLASDVTHVKIKYAVIVPDDNTSLIVHRIHIASDAFPVGQTTVTGFYEIEQATSALTNRAAEIEFNLGSASIQKSGIDFLFPVDDSVNTRTKFFSNKDATLSVKFTTGITTVGYMPSIKVNDSDIYVGNQAIVNGGMSSISIEFPIKSGQFFTVGIAGNNYVFADSTTNSALVANLTVSATAYADNVIVDAATFNADSYLVYSGTSLQPSAPSVTFGGLQESKGTAITTSDNLAFTVHEDGIYSIHTSITSTTLGGIGIITRNYTGTDGSDVRSLKLGENQQGNGYLINIDWTGPLKKDDVIRIICPTLLSTPNAKLTISKIATPPSFISLDVSSERENNYLATADRTTTNGLVNLSENRLGYIQSLTRTGTGIYVGVYKTGFFPTSPKSLATQGSAVADQVTVSIRNETATGFTAYVVDVSGVARDEAFNIFTTRGDADYRPQQAFIAGQVALTEARTDGVPYRINKKVDGQWVWAVTLTGSSISDTDVLVSGTSKLVDSYGTFGFTATVQRYVNFHNGVDALGVFRNVSTGDIYVDASQTWTNGYEITVEYLP